MGLFRKNKTKKTKEFNYEELMEIALRKSPSSLTDEEREFLLSKFEERKNDK